MRNVPQTCYIAQVEARKHRDNIKKTIFTTITTYDEKGSSLSKTNGNEADKEIYMLHHNHDDRKKHYDEGRLKYIEYILEGHLIVFCEYSYKTDFNGFVYEMRIEAYWEGKAIVYRKPTTGKPFEFTSPFGNRKIT